jgi:hypothetical protein
MLTTVIGARATTKAAPEMPAKLPVGAIVTNDYNPNRMAKEGRTLLTTVIAARNATTKPILVSKDLNAEGTGTSSWTAHRTTPRPSPPAWRRWTWSISKATIKRS